MTELELIRGCQKNRRDCQRQLFYRYSPRLMAVAKRYTNQLMEAEDVLQEAFIKIFDKIAQFRVGEGSFEGWMCRIVITSAISSHRKQKRHKEAYGMEGIDPGVEPEILAQLHSEQLEALISNLPAGYREVFNLYVVDGYTHPEIANLLGVSEGTSRSQLYRARKILQAQILELKKIQVC